MPTLGSQVTSPWTGTAAAASVDVVPPTGAAPTITVTGAPGAWSATWTPTVPGRHTVIWQATAGPALVWVDLVEVAAAADVPIVPVADVAAHLRMTSVPAGLESMALAASGSLEAWLGRPVRPAQQVVRAPGRAAAVRVPVPCPCAACAACDRVVEVTALTDAGTAVDLGDVTVDGVAGLVSRVDGTWWTGPTVVTVTSGCRRTPAWARLGLLRLVEHLWARSQQARHTRGGGVGEEWSPGDAFSLPLAVQQHLDPHATEGL